MWSEFGNRARLHRGGRGYMGKVQGWEFVPGCRLEVDKNGGKSCSPLRMLSNPSVGGIQEGPLGGMEARDPETWLELQTQHSRLKRKLEGLKKQHERDKQEWMREKEHLLRQVADIQGGENRRILLDLKSLLEDVQLKVKREEADLSSLQRQYSADRHAWELERAELQNRITQLEARGGRSGVELGARDMRRQHEEHRRLLSDTHTAAMALRSHLERSEQGWAHHRAEVLERFDAERREWELQLQDMQRKVEELCDEVKAHQDRTGTGPASSSQNGPLRLSLRSDISASSILTNPASSDGSGDRLDGCINGHGDSIAHHEDGSTDPASHQSNGEWDSYAAEFNKILQGCLDHKFELNSPKHQTSSSPTPRTHQALRSPSPQTSLLCNSPSPSTHPTFSSPFLNMQHAFGSPFSSIQQAFGNFSCNMQQPFISPSPATQLAYCNPSLNTSQSLTSSVCKPQVFGVPRENAERKNITALNAAYKEIAKVSEELCSYQDEIRKKTERRNESFPCLQEFVEVENVKNQARNGDTSSIQSAWHDFQLLEEQDWISWEGTVRNLQSRPLQKKTATPPVPLRTTSWFLQSSTAPEAPESHTDYKRGSGVSMDRKSSSPSVLRKFGAMLQENEGKTLTASGVVTDVVPTDSKCNISCCHSQASCDGSRFGSSKSSAYTPVQKCVSEAPMEEAPASRQNQGPRQHGDWLQPMDQDLLKVALESPSYSEHKKSDETLDLKTAEFNRIVFHAETGSEFMKDRLPPEHLHPNNQVKGSISKDPTQTQVKPKSLSTGDQIQCLKDPEDLAAFSQLVLRVGTQAKAQRTKPVGSTQKASEAGPLTSSCLAQDSDTQARHWVLNEQPWRPRTLAAYPRPADSRSNYGAIERILKSYESGDRSEPSLGKEDDLIRLLDMLKLDQLPSHSQRLSCMESQATAAFKGTAGRAWESRKSPLSHKKSFSRPARPPNQRPPSRWAGRAPSSAERVAPSSALAHKQTLSLSCHAETIIL